MRPVFCGPDGQGSTDNALHTLLVSDRRTGRPVAGFSAGRSSDWDDRTTAFATPKFSPDAHSIYIVGRLTLCETGTWRDKPHVFRVDVRDADPRPAHFVAAGRLIAIVRSGPHAGCLLVQQQGTVGRDPVVLFSPTGVRIRAIPGSDRVGKAATGPWLKAQGWRVY